MNRKERVCDICGAVIERNEEIRCGMLGSVRGKFRMAKRNHRNSYYFTWQKIDVCSQCIDKLAEEVKNTRKEKAK